MRTLSLVLSCTESTLRFLSKISHTNDARISSSSPPRVCSWDGGGGGFTARTWQAASEFSSGMRRSAASGRGHQEAATITRTLLNLLAGAALVATVAASMDATKGEDVPVHFKTPTSLRGHHDPADHIPDISHPHSRVEDADDITWANLRVTPPEAARRNPRDTNVTTAISLPTTLLGGRFVTFSLYYGRTFNRVRSMLNLLELAIILNRTAILPGFDDAGRECVRESAVALFPSSPLAPSPRSALARSSRARSERSQPTVISCVLCRVHLRAAGTTRRTFASTTPSPPTCASSTSRPSSPSSSPNSPVA